MFAKILKSLHTDGVRARTRSRERTSTDFCIFVYFLLISLFLCYGFTFCVFVCVAYEANSIGVVGVAAAFLLIGLFICVIKQAWHFFFLCRQLNINFTPKTIHSLQVHSLLTLKTRNILRDVRAVNGKVHLFVKLLVLCNSHYYYYPKSRDALCVAQHFFLLWMLCMKRQRVRSLTPNNIPSKPSFVRIYLIQTEHILI